MSLNPNEQFLPRSANRLVGPVADARRLRQLFAVGGWVWCAFFLVDWLIAIPPGDSSWVLYAAVRGVGAALIFGAGWTLRETAAITVKRVMAADFGVFTIVGILVGVLSAEFQGPTSPYFPGVLMLLMARGTTVTEPRRRGMIGFSLPALGYAFGLAGCIFASPALQFRLSNPQVRNDLLADGLILIGSTILVVAGSHVAWSLRSELFAARIVDGYTLRRRIGGGAMGEVWVAHHHALRRDVALKILSATSPTDTTIARFEREILATTELEHPNTVRVFDCGTTEDGLRYYAMELLHGRDLRQLLRERGALSPARAWFITHQTARALGEAHSRGIVHRDVKPANIFIAELGGEVDVVKVLDFGIAHMAAASRSGDSDVMGTPMYMSPEAARGENTGPQSDVYGLGAVFYHCLTGGPPFEARRIEDMFSAHERDLPTPPSLKVAHVIPRDLEALVLRALAKDPQSRPADGHAFARALEACEVAFAWKPGIDHDEEWATNRLELDGRSGVWRGESTTLRDGEIGTQT